MGIYESLAIIAIFPLIVAMEAGSSVSGKSKKCSFLGNISYPLYIVHYPIVFTLLGAWKTNNPDISLSTTIFVNVATFLFCLAVAYATLKLYDDPVRKWLKQHWFMSKREYKQTTAKLKI